MAGLLRLQAQGTRHRLRLQALPRQILSRAPAGDARRDDKHRDPLQVQARRLYLYPDRRAPPATAGGRATGAKPAVIVRAFREMFIFARKWRREEQQERRALAKPASR